MSLDDLFDKFEQDDLEGAEKLSPRDYAKLRGMAPQMVYYYIRNGVVDTETCICGKRVVDVSATDEAIQTRKEARRK
jgi:hypothetical protein